MTSELYFGNDKFYDLTTTIANGQTDSNVVDLNGLELVGFFIPSNFTATSLTIQTSTAVNGTFVLAQDGFGSTFTIPVTADRYVPINNFNVIAGLRFIKLTAGASQTPTDAIIPLAIRSL